MVMKVHLAEQPMPDVPSERRPDNDDCAGWILKAEPAIRKPGGLDDPPVSFTWLGMTRPRHKKAAQKGGFFP